MLDFEEAAEVERAVGAALASGSADTLRVLGYGEFTVVVGWPADEPTLAVKRLPPDPDRSRLERYANDIERYCDELRALGVDVAPHWASIVPATDGGWALHIAQPFYPTGTLATDVLRSTAPVAGHPTVSAVVAHLARAHDELGLDAQFSNWVIVDDGVVLIDTTTPMIRDDGRDILDVDLMLLPFPAVVRPALRRFVAPDVLARFHEPRMIAIDTAAQLHKEQLGAWIPIVIDEANRRLDQPITQEEVDAYYREDARLWSLIQRAKQANRWWTRRVRRRSYPFLLPGPINR